MKLAFRVLVMPGAGVDARMAQELIDRARTEGVSLTGPDGLLRRVTKTVLESTLNAELDEHLGYEKGAQQAKSGSNERNGSSSKTVRTDVGEARLNVPRDREDSFEPQVVPKHSRRLEGFDEVVISLYAKGLTTGEIQAHVAEIYGVQVSREMISKITDKVLDDLQPWQARPLDEWRRRRWTRRFKLFAGFGDPVDAKLTGRRAEPDAAVEPAAAQPEHIVDLTGIDELTSIARNDEPLTIGAMCRRRTSSGPQKCGRLRHTPADRLLPDPLSGRRWQHRTR